MVIADISLQRLSEPTVVCLSPQFQVRLKLNPSWTTAPALLTETECRHFSVALF